MKEWSSANEVLSAHETFVTTTEKIKTGYAAVAPTSINLTTMTVVGSIGHDIDLGKIRDYFGTRVSFGTWIGRRTDEGRRSARGAKYEWRMRDTKFQNQVTLDTRDAETRKSVKLFPNGSIQIAGCHDIKNCCFFVHHVARALAHILDIPVPVDLPFRVAMINSNFSVDRRVNLRVAHRVFAAMDGVDATFDPDRYSAVMVKFRPYPGAKRVSASVFGSGKIIITGAKDLRETVTAYERILNTFDASAATMLVGDTMGDAVASKSDGLTVREFTVAITIRDTRYAARVTTR